jgi:hypothetical protein
MAPIAKKTAIASVTVSSVCRLPDPLYVSDSGTVDELAPEKDPDDLLAEVLPFGESGTPLALPMPWEEEISPLLPIPFSLRDPEVVDMDDEPPEVPPRSAWPLGDTPDAPLEIDSEQLLKPLPRVPEIEPEVFPMMPLECSCESPTAESYEELCMQFPVFPTELAELEPLEAEPRELEPPEVELPELEVSRLKPPELELLTDCAGARLPGKEFGLPEGDWKLSARFFDKYSTAYLGRDWNYSSCYCRGDYASACSRRSW